MKNTEFHRKLPIPKEIKELYPLTDYASSLKKKKDMEIVSVISGKSPKKLIIIGPCSADREDAVLDYCERLAVLQEKVLDKLVLIPRVYTNKPRTTCEGYKGMVHQPDPHKGSDMLEGIVATRRLHLAVLSNTGLSTADEMLYPENFRYISDLVSYETIGARSVENQEHRLVSSGLDIPVGMKNPTGGDISVMLNSISAAQHGHTFIYRGWEVVSTGNPLSHGIIRGYVNHKGESIPNYHFEDLEMICSLYKERKLDNTAIIVDTNHSNSDKHYERQPEICREVVDSMGKSCLIKDCVKGFMIESYIEDGKQNVGDGEYGKSITDPCLGWEKTEKLILELCEKL